MQNPVCVWDFTWYNLRDEEQAFKILDLHCKKWTFQEEKCPKTGNLHFQGRVSLKIKNRAPYWPDCDIKFTPTSEVNHKNDFYVTKPDTRVRGPWSDKDEKIVVPRDIKAIKELLPWQKQLFSLIKVENNTRKVYVVIDETGNSGKSTFVRWCMVYKHGRKIPMANDYKDILRMVMDMPTSNCYFVDMPRAINKEKLYQFYSAIEEIKGGYAFDDRYKFQEKIFDPPNVVIFTNRCPDLALLSYDRWVLLSIRDGYLINYQNN